MPRSYTNVKHLELQVFEMKANGKTNTEIAQLLGLTKTQIKELVKRHNRRERKIAEGEIVRSKGRPRTRPLTTNEEQKEQIKRLKMENELLRSFLQAVGKG
jgi:transposase